MKIFLFVLLALGAINNAAADCSYEGSNYPTGSIVNGYVCQEDGTWGNG